jgi:hypothetical protein
MLKHCFKQCSSMQKSLPPVRWCARPYGEHEQIMRGRHTEVGVVTGPILERKISRWPGLSVSAGSPWRPTKRPRDAQIYSCLIIPLRPAIRDRLMLRRSKRAIRMLVGHRRREIRLTSRVTVSCLMSRVTVPSQEFAHPVGLRGTASDQFALDDFFVRSDHSITRELTLARECRADCKRHGPQCMCLGIVPTPSAAGRS